MQVCAFAAESDMEMKGKVLMRLQDITELQRRLQTCMTGTPPSVLMEPKLLCVFLVACPGFWPPSVSMSEEVSAAVARKRCGYRLVTSHVTVM